MSNSHNSYLLLQSGDNSKEHNCIPDEHYVQTLLTVSFLGKRKKEDKFSLVSETLMLFIKHKLILGRKKNVYFIHDPSFL